MSWYSALKNLRETIILIFTLEESHFYIDYDFAAIFNMKKICTGDITFRDMLLTGERYFMSCFIFHHLYHFTEPAKFKTSHPLFRLDYVDKM